MTEIQPDWSTRKTVVLVPTYNERENLPNIVPAILNAAPVDVWILDDNSPDGTGKIADTLVSKYERVRVTHRPQKLGLGRAYIDGFRDALAMGYERIAHMDADFSHDPKVLPQLLAQAEHYDVVLGSRWVQGGSVKNWPWTRRFISRGGSWYARTILGVAIRDLTGGFKCFRREVLDGMNLNIVQSTGYSFQIEMTYRALKSGYKIVEIPITFVERLEGHSKMTKAIILEAIVQVVRLKLTV